jgi:membrane associated rhomboid family serine protease
MRNYRFQGFGLNPVMAIIGLNLMFFVITWFNQGAAYRLLGLTPALIIAQPWTILTSMFMHSGFGHIFANMFTLYFFGSHLSSIIGDKKFLLVYFGGGILGNILFVLLSYPFSTAIGASGAVFAIAGALVVLNPRIRVYVFFILPLPLWAAVIFGFLILSFFPGVAWQAHLGGLVFGLIAGYFFRRDLRRRYRW